MLNDLLYLKFKRIMKKNKIILSFSLLDFNDITPEEITQLLNVNPTKICVKGQRRNPKNPESPLIKQNGWMIDSPLGQYASFEDQMNSLLDIIESKIDIFRALCKMYYCEFSCAIFMYLGNEESTPWVHLDSRYNELIKELNIEFDLDLYVFPNEEVSNSNL
ncbi:hypothetical protein D3C86_1439770 [compost metagenome]